MLARVLRVVGVGGVLDWLWMWGWRAALRRGSRELVSEGQSGL